MSPAETTGSGPAGQPAHGFPWLMLVLGWVGVSIFLIVRVAMSWGVDPLIADTDDAMRLVVVHDFLAGQNWYDHFQHRLNTPFGAEIHWSRLVDVPIGAMILLARPFAGASADTVAAFMWPLLVLFFLLFASARLAFRLAGPAGVFPAIVLPALSPALLAEFEPGRMDHHSVQIALAVAMAWCAVEAVHRPNFAVWAGVLTATVLAIGTEGLPTVGSAILAIGLIWVLDGQRATALRWFGLGFGLAALAHLAIALPPSRWMEQACDALSLVYVVFAVLVGIAFFVLSVLPLEERSPLLRLLVGAVFGVAVAAPMALAFPDCIFKGPYAAVDAWLVLNWIVYIAEAKPIWSSFGDIPAYVAAVAVPPVIALTVTLARLIRVRADRTEWIVYGIFLLLSVVVMVLQIRGARIAAALVVPAGAYLIVVARNAFLHGRRKLLAAAGLVLSYLGYAGIILAMIANAVVMALPSNRPPAGPPGPNKVACLLPPSFADLAAMPPERLMTPIDLGAHMLLYTPHSVVAAPYHRNEDGVRATFDFFNRPIEEARKILVARGISLVVTCPAMPEMRGFGDAPQDSFVRLFGRGELPPWLVDESLPDSPFRVYSVMPEAVTAR